MRYTIFLVNNEMFSYFLSITILELITMRNILIIILNVCICYIHIDIYALVIKIDAYSGVIELFPETRYTTLITVFFLPLSFLIAQ